MVIRFTPALTRSVHQVYIWGGGKTSPQTLATFKKDLGAVRVCVAPKHFCVVTVEKEQNNGVKCRPVPGSNLVALDVPPPH